MLKLFHDAGWVAYPLGLCSIIALAIILERIFTLVQLRKTEDGAYAALKAGLERGDDSAMRDPAYAAAPVTQVMNTLGALRGASEDSMQQAADIAISMQRLRLRRYLSTLATIGSTAPFIGLFGTVLGVMSAFQSMSRSGLSNETMASGISEALSATALGLLVAIPSVMAYNFLLGRSQGTLLYVHSHVANLIPLLRPHNAANYAREKQEA